MEASRRCWSVLAQHDQFQFEHFSHNLLPGNGDEEGREGGGEQQQATGHTPRRGKRGENQGVGIIKKSKKSILGKPCTSGKQILFKNQEKSWQALHEWIEQLCDPEENFCESLRVQLERGWDAEVEQDARVSWDKDKYSEKGKRE